jgi:glycosyltransferase involved in cell wall biosynthesis
MAGMSIAKARTASNPDVRFFIEISPMFESNWTGLANVTANIARYFLETKPANTYFFVGTNTILRAYVGTAVRSAPGAYLRSLVSSGFAAGQTLHHALAHSELSVAIFPNLKPFHRVFDIEVLVAHDLSALLMPELHRAQAAEAHAAGLSRDVFTSDLICCVSDATKQDVLRYLRVPEEKLFVSHLGVDANDPAKELLPNASTLDYAVVLGTIEPRKNMRLIAEFLHSMPDKWKDLVIFFVGSPGWGKSFEEIFEQVIRSPYGDRIFFTGFVPEPQKLRLLARAKFAIYPSLFEGFGLPIIEAMAAGCPIIASNSSSMTELGLDSPFYFDPTSLADFIRAFELILNLSDNDRSKLSRRLRVKASHFSWKAFGDRLLANIERCVEK